MPGNTYSGMGLHYDMKNGFFLDSVTIFNSGNYMCLAKHLDKESTAPYELNILRKGNLDVFLTTYINNNLIFA